MSGSVNVRFGMLLSLVKQAAYFEFCPGPVLPFTVGPVTVL